MGYVCWYLAQLWQHVDVGPSTGLRVSAQLGPDGCAKWLDAAWRQVPPFTDRPPLDIRVRLRAFRLCLVDAAFCMGWTWQGVAETNLAKLRDRKARGVIKGQGSSR